mgnify:FL=1
MKNKIKLENIMCVFIILCPILDMTSFIFRNTFNTKLSPSTIIRPLIPTLVILYLFIKKDKKFKKNLLITGIVYAVYALIHIYLFSKVKTGMSCGTETHELQYIINYTFMIINLIIFTVVFKEENIDKMKKSVLIATGIYIISIYISILTKTSSHTYIEGMGYKGWFESGNSISAILLLTMFIYLPYVKNKKYRKFVIPILVLVGIFLSMLIGTRAGLFGFIIIIALYMGIEVLFNILKNEKIDKKFFIIGFTGIAIIVLIIIGCGSTTLQRRKHLKDIESDIIDETSQENAHITGSTLKIKEQIEKNEIEEGYMSDAQKQSIIDLYNIANKLQVKNNDQRMQQLIYNIVLVKNQKNIFLILFGNGYVANFSELVLEMELVSMLLNFGVIGFLLYMGPFFAIFLMSLYYGIKYIKQIDSEYVFLWFGSAMAFALSLLSGYTFFSSSSAIMIISINTILFIKMQKIKRENIEQDVKLKGIK